MNYVEMAMRLRAHRSASATLTEMMRLGVSNEDAYRATRIASMRLAS
jgi:hypothetical protein